MNLARFLVRLAKLLCTSHEHGRHKLVARRRDAFSWLLRCNLLIACRRRSWSGCSGRPATRKLRHARPGSSCMMRRARRRQPGKPQSGPRRRSSRSRRSWPSSGGTRSRGTEVWRVQQPLAHTQVGQRSALSQCHRVHVVQFRVDCLQVICLQRPSCRPAKSKAMLCSVAAAH